MNVTKMSFKYHLIVINPDNVVILSFITSDCPSRGAVGSSVWHFFRRSSLGLGDLA